MESHLPFSASARTILHRLILRQLLLQWTAVLGIVELRADVGGVLLLADLLLSGLGRSVGSVVVGARLLRAVDLADFLSDLVGVGFLRDDVPPELRQVDLWLVLGINLDDGLGVEGVVSRQLGLLEGRLVELHEVAPAQEFVAHQLSFKVRPLVSLVLVSAPTLKKERP